MAIKFRHNGRLWEADTVEEAVALRKKLESDDDSTYEVGEEPSVIREYVWTHDTAMEFVKSVGSLQSLFLEELIDHQLSSDKLIEALKLESEIALAGVLSGLSKQAKKVGVKPDDVYNTRIQWNGKDKIRTFSLRPNFQYTAMEIGWPWKKKK